MVLFNKLSIIFLATCLCSTAFGDHGCDNFLDSSYTLLLIPNSNGKVHGPSTRGPISSFQASNGEHFPITNEGRASDGYNGGNRSVILEVPGSETVQKGKQYRFSISQPHSYKIVGSEIQNSQYRVSIAAFDTGKKFTLECYGAPCQVKTFLTNSNVNGQEVFLEKNGEIVTSLSCHNENTEPEHLLEEENSTSTLSDI